MKKFVEIFVWGLCLPCLWLAPIDAAAEPLTLRVSDGVAVPGNLMAVVLRTYAPRGLTQGQICLGTGGGNPFRPGVEKALGGGILEDLVDVQVFSDGGDADFQAAVDPETGMVELSFHSPSAGVNSQDGPMAVLYFRVAADAPAGTVLEWTVDPGASSLLDGQSTTVPIEARPGSLEIQAPGSPLELSFEDATAAVGGLAELYISSERSLPLDRGELWIELDPAWTADLPPGAAEAFVDQRFGEVTTTLEVVEPGRLRLIFDAVDPSFHRLPGEAWGLRLPLPSVATEGSRWPLVLGTESFVVPNDGSELTLELDPAELVVVASPPLFENGFEAGNLAAWSAVRP